MQEPTMIISHNSKDGTHLRKNLISVKSHMNNILLQSVHTKMKRIEHLLQQESQRTLLTGVKAIAERSAAEDTIQDLLSELTSLALQRKDICSHIAPRLEAFSEQLSSLPFVPRIEALTWAENLWQLKPRILVINDDFDEHRQEAFIQQIAVLDWTKKLIFHHRFCGKQSSFAPSSSPKDLLSRKRAEAPSVPVAQMWNALLQAVSGHVIVTYSLPLAQIQLEVTAKRLHLKVPMLIGISLLDLCQRYLGYEKEEVSLEKEEAGPVLPFSSALCTQLGDPFSETISCDAVKRAEFIFTALQDITQGTLNVSA